MYIRLNNKIDYDIRTYRNHRKEKSDYKVKIKTGIGSTVGTVLPMLYIAKKQNVRLHKINYGLKEMLLVSTGAITGGLFAGLISDKKKYRKQKINEGVFQFMNSAVPTLLTAGLLSICEKNKQLNNVPFKIGSTCLGLFGGMLMAAKLSNLINDPFDKVPDRKLTIKDSIANIDDALGALVLAKFPMAEKLQAEKILPVIYGWCGYRAGTSN